MIYWEEHTGPCFEHFGLCLSSSLNHLLRHSRCEDEKHVQACSHLSCYAMRALNNTLQAIGPWYYGYFYTLAGVTCSCGHGNGIIGINHCPVSGKSECTGNMFLMKDIDSRFQL